MFSARSLRRKTFYNDLSSHKFSVEDKVLCVNAYLTAKAANEVTGVLAFAERYNLKRQTIAQWVKTVEEGHALHAECGKPPAIDDIGLESVNQRVKEMVENIEPPNEHLVLQLIQDEGVATNQRRGVNPQQISERTAHTYLAKAGLVKRKPQTVTPARVKACSDFRMMYSMIVMSHAIMADLPSYCLWNFDATQFVIDAVGSGQHVYISKEHDFSRPISIMHNESLPFAIKYLHLSNAAGQMAPMVFVIAVDGFPDGQYAVRKITGLDTRCPEHDTTYLVLAPTRAVTSEFYQWLFTTVFIPFMVTCRDRLELVVSEVLC
jgi:hypothetical protein